MSDGVQLAQSAYYMRHHRLPGSQAHTKMPTLEQDEPKLVLKLTNAAASRRSFDRIKGMDRKPAKRCALVDKEVLIEAASQNDRSLSVSSNLDPLPLIDPAAARFWRTSFATSLTITILLGLALAVIGLAGLLSHSPGLSTPWNRLVNVRGPSPSAAKARRRQQNLGSRLADR